MVAQRRCCSFRGHYAKYGVVRFVHSVTAYGGEIGDGPVYGIIDNAFERSNAMAFHGYEGADYGSGDSGGKFERTAGFGSVANHAGYVGDHIFDGECNLRVIASHQVSYGAARTRCRHHAAA